MVLSVLIGKKFGRYEIRSKIGEGGMGEVYTAHDPELNRDVAIKILFSEFSGDKARKSRFRQEARAVSALNHPNIITIYEIGENEYGSFIVTELIDGKTLREIIKREPLSLIRTLKIIEQTANALVAAHNAHIVHRDIKPENIMVRHDSIVKVLDFGLAKPTLSPTENAVDEDETVKTIPGIVMGSARYMSPEQTRGITVDERTDIWSLGVVLYEMLTGKAPFDGTNTSDTIAAVIYKEPESLLNLVRHAPPELQRIVRKSLQKDRDERYQSIKDLALDVKDLLYEVEHEISAERAQAASADLELSENPTMIHQTVSTTQPTKTSTLSTADISYPLDPPKKRSLWMIPASFGLLVILTIFGFGFYRWMNPKTNLTSTAFEKSQVSRVNTDGKVLMPTISPDGKYLAYISGEAGSRSLVVRQVSTDSLVTVVQPTNLSFSAIAFSPDGDYIYYCLTRSDFSVNTLYQVPTLGGTSKKLIEDVDSAITFSPGGKQFAFIRHTSNTNEDIVFTVDAGNLNIQPLISTKQTNFDFFSARPAWSPDGQKILIGAGKRQGGFTTEMAITEISVAEKTLKTISPQNWFTVGNFIWFKDGSGFLFAGRETQTSPVQLWRSSYPNGETHAITNDFNDYTELGLAADGKTIVTLKGDSASSLWRYSPMTKENVQLLSDSRNLEGSSGLIQLRDGKLVYTRNEGKELDFWSSDADGKNPRVLLNDSNIIFSPVATPDGRYVVFNSQKFKSSRIWRMDADGKNPIQLTEENPNYADYNPQVTGDGKTVIFQRQKTNDDRTSLMKISIDGRQEALPFYENNKWSVSQPHISPDGKRIAFGAYDVDTFEKRLKIASLDGDLIGPIEKDLEYNLINQFYWSPDSKSLTISSSRDGVPNLSRLPIDGSSASQPLTDFKSGKILNFAWSNDGKNLFIVRGTTNNDLILIRDASPNAKG